MKCSKCNSEMEYNIRHEIDLCKKCYSEVEG